MMHHTRNVCITTAALHVSQVLHCAHSIKYPKSSMTILGDFCSNHKWHRIDLFSHTLPCGDLPSLQSLHTMHDQYNHEDWYSSTVAQMLPFCSTAAAIVCFMWTPCMLQTSSLHGLPTCTCIACLGTSCQSAVDVFDQNPITQTVHTPPFLSQVTAPQMIPESDHICDFDTVLHQLAC